MNTKIMSIAIMGVALALAGVVRQTHADVITWHYEDDFSTEKAKNDSYDHTPFYPIEQYHPLPALCYWPEKEILVFEGDSINEEPAFLAYAIPLESVMCQIDSGIFEIKVNFVSECPFPTYLSYELSSDGLDWSEASPLIEGYNQIPLLPTNNSLTYIKLLGDNVDIDDLLVTVSGQEIPEPITIALFGLGMVGIIIKRKG